MQSAAFKYLDFATSIDITFYWSQNTGYMPVRKSALKDIAATLEKEAQPVIKLIKDLEG